MNDRACDQTPMCPEDGEWFCAACCGEGWEARDNLRKRLQAAEARAEKAERERNDFRARLAEVALYTRIDGGVDGPCCIESDPPIGSHAPGSERGVCDFCVIHGKARIALSPTPESEPTEGAVINTDNISKKVNSHLHTVIDGLTAKNEHLQQWIDDLQAGMYINCVYCGHRYGPDVEMPASMADVLKAHVEECPEHPMSKLKAEHQALVDEFAQWKKQQNDS